MNSFNTNAKKNQLDSNTITRIASGTAILLLLSSLYLIIFNSTILYTGIEGYVVLLLLIILLLLYAVSLMTGELFADYIIRKRNK